MPIGVEDTTNVETSKTHMRSHLPSEVAGGWATTEVDELARHLVAWGETLDSRLQRERSISRLLVDINGGLTLDDLLDDIFTSFESIIPYDRIGCSIVSEDRSSVTARWARARYEETQLNVGYSAPLKGSSLLDVLETGKPRVISDLKAYLTKKPESESTRLVVDEGIRSSLTCPLIADGIPIGFLYFSSRQPGTYDDEHIELFQQLASPVSVLVEKARLVSDLAEQRELLASQNAELSELNTLKSQLVGMVAHDVRNPLASIIMLADHLHTSIPEEPAENREFIQEIQGQVKHLLELVENLLDLTKIESGTISLDPQPTDIRTLLAGAVRFPARVAQSKGTVINLDEVPEGSVTADPQRLRQVVDNLISNAVKFSPPGSVITIRAIRDDLVWIIEVEDQGPGISPSDRERLFVRFAKLSARPTGNESSSGLGLAICKHLVEAHDGQIGVRQAPGGGSVFWFAIPRQRVAPQPGQRPLGH